MLPSAWHDHQTYYISSEASRANSGSPAFSVMLPIARVIQVDTRGAVILQEESPEVCDVVKMKKKIFVLT
jgi:hypothetical protein